MHRFTGRDGTELAYRELGEGRTLVLLHGFFSSAIHNWLAPGHAARIAGRGYRVVMPDLRGHGDSAKPHDPAAYPPDVLADDGFALVEHLGLDDYDLGGYSLGARTVVRMLARGATPARAIVAGQGLDAITLTAGRPRSTMMRRVFANLGTFAPGTRERAIEDWLHTIDGDPVALLHVLDTSVDTPLEALARIETPTLVVMGGTDENVRSAAPLADALPYGEYAEVPGNHTTVVTEPDRLGQAIADFLGRRRPCRSPATRSTPTRAPATGSPAPSTSTPLPRP